MTCDVCGATDPPRNPLWRSNAEKVCDPCWARISEAIGEREAAAATPDEAYYKGWTAGYYKAKRQAAGKDSPATPSLDQLIEILDDAEGDGIIGPDYTPPRLAEYILARLDEGSATPDQTGDINDDGGSRVRTAQPRPVRRPTTDRSWMR